MRRHLGVSIMAAVALAGPAMAAQQKSDAEQIAEAVSPLPEPLREGATVLGYRQAGKLTTLRRGTNGMVCLADDPERDNFHVACYQKELEAFMARGRELRAEGMSTPEVRRVRESEIEGGRLQMPPHATLYSLTGQSQDSARPLFVIYVPYATIETLGITDQPSREQPWLMSAGKPWAHIMISGK